jgi:hypothetical protein
LRSKKLQLLSQLPQSNQLLLHHLLLLPQPMLLSKRNQRKDTIKNIITIKSITINQTALQVIVKVKANQNIKKLKNITKKKKHQPQQFKHHPLSLHQFHQLNNNKNLLPQLKIKNHQFLQIN